MTYHLTGLSPMACQAIDSIVYANTVSLMCTSLSESILDYTVSVIIHLLLVKPNSPHPPYIT